ncbi:HD domain-containing protein [bacterium]|nr:MAG: HD domain-containing protein [bacterium]
MQWVLKQNKMKIDYKKELETAAKNMILVHEPNALITMIARLMVQKVGAMHTGILLHDEEEKSYIIRVSRGAAGMKVPAGFARMNYSNPLIRLFREYKESSLVRSGIFIYRENGNLTKRVKDFQLKEVIEGALHQMDILEAVVCIPSYFHDELLGILFLGRKKNKREFHRTELDFFVALASDVAMAIRNAQLFKRLQDELDRRQELFINTTVALAAAIEAKDNYTRGHTERVTNISMDIAKMLKNSSLYNIDDKFLEYLHIAALLHDIGKIGVPESILNKQGPLDTDEWEKMRLHPVIGAKMLQSIKELDQAIKGIKYHHERFDGKGYPEGLIGDSIPLIAAIISVADSYDAITSDRPYRKGRTMEEGVAEIRRLSGQQFHPQIVEAFVKLTQEKKI